MFIASQVLKSRSLIVCILHKLIYITIILSLLYINILDWISGFNELLIEPLKCSPEKQKI